MTRSAPLPYLSTLPPIQWVVTYFDTVKVLIPSHLSKAEQTMLKDLDASLHYDAKDQNGMRGVFCAYQGRTYPFVAVLTLQRFSRELVEIMEEIFKKGPPPLVTAAHVALDLIVTNREEAELLQDGIETRLLKRGHRLSHSIAKYKNTRYYGQRGLRSVVAIYSDKPCRIGGNPCCHVERRIQGHPALKEQDLSTLSDLLGFNPRTFWARGLHLIELRSDAIQRIGEALYRKGTRRQLFQDRNAARQRWRINGGIFLRSVAAQEGSYPYPTATGLAVALKRYGLPPLRRFGKPIDVSGLMPSVLTFKLPSNQ